MKKRTNNIGLLWRCLLAACLCLSAASGGYVSAQTVLPKGIPFIQNFSASQYGASTQNWDVAEDPNTGLVYVANTLGLLVFDGTTWGKVKISGANSTARSLAVDADGRVYAGLVGDFGFVGAGKAGEAEFKSLRPFLPDTGLVFKDIRSIVVHNGKVYFQADRHIFAWDGKKISATETETSFSRMFAVGEDVYFEEDKKGLMRVSPARSDLRQTVLENPALEKTGMIGLLPFGKNKILYVTSEKGLFAFDLVAKRLEAIPSPKVEAFLQGDQLRSASFSRSGDYLLGTSKKGLLVLDNGLRFKNVIDESSGLANNFVLKTMQDARGNLWIALNNGLAFAEYYGAFSVFDKRNGLPGKALNLYRFEDVLYISTDVGIYTLKLNGNAAENPRFEPIPELQDRSWFVSGFDGSFFAGSGSGLFEKKGGGAWRQISDQLSFVIRPSAKYPGYAFCGLKKGLLVLKKTKNGWTPVKNIKGIDEQIRGVEEDGDGFLWAASPKNGLFRVQFLQSPEDSAQITRYGKESGFYDEFWNFPYQSSQGLLVGGSRGIYKFDPAKNIFSIDKSLTGRNFLFDSSEVYCFAEDKAQNIWFWLDKKVGVLQKKGTEIVSDFKTFRRLPANSLYHILPDENGAAWIGHTEGAVLYQTPDSAAKGVPITFRALVRSVWLIKNDSLIYGGSNISQDGIAAPTQGDILSAFPFAQNSFRFVTAAPFMESPQPVKFSFMLEGFDEGWSNWSEERKKDYTNLPQGQFIFKVKALNAFGDESQEAVYRFSVLPPWYKSWPAYLCYALLGIVLFYAALRLYAYKLMRGTLKLEKLVKIRTKEIERQKQEIETKNKELQRRESEISEQKNEVSKQKDKAEKAYSNVKILSKIGQKITSNLDFATAAETVYQNVSELMDAAEFSVGLYNEDSKSLSYIFSVSEGKISERPQEMLLDGKPRFAAECVIKSKAICIGDLRAGHHEYPYLINLGAYTGLPPFKSLMCIPLLFGGKATGLIEVRSPRTNAYSDLELDILQTLASYTSIALANADNFGRLLEANKEIALKNEHILDSIRYARHIQMNMLPKIGALNAAFAEAFILYKPKDIVSGDFYWLAEVRDARILGVFDCTGHGVPGALMMMLGISLLNDIVNQRRVSDPAKILEELDMGLRFVVNQHSNEVDEGMDACLCRIEKSNKVVFAGAKRHLIYVYSGYIDELRGDRKSLGGKQLEEKRTFTNHTLDLDKNSMLYLSTDGFVDQHNKEREKIGIIRLKEVLSRVHDIELIAQKGVLEEILANHKMDEEQRDDITILGIRL